MGMTLPFAVALPAQRSTSEKTMSAMRLCFDMHGNPDVRFETATDGIGILISVEFSANNIADAFARRFGNAPPAIHVIAA